MKLQKNKVLFREVQRFPQTWILILIVVLVVFSWYSFFQQIVLGKPFGTNPAPDLMVWIIWLLFGIGLPWLFWVSKLIVEIKEDRIIIRFYPLHSRTVFLKDIKSCTTRQYNPILEYGGWGIRWSPWKGMAYNASGNLGVQLELASGKQILIGSQIPEKLAQAIDQGLKKK